MPSYINLTRTIKSISNTNCTRRSSPTSKPNSRGTSALTMTSASSRAVLSLRLRSFVRVLVNPGLRVLQSSLERDGRDVHHPLSRDLQGRTGSEEHRNDRSHSTDAQESHESHSCCSSRRSRGRRPRSPPDRAAAAARNARSGRLRRGRAHPRCPGRACAASPRPGGSCGPKRRALPRGPSWSGSDRSAAARSTPRGGCWDPTWASSLALNLAYI